VVFESPPRALRHRHRLRLRGRVQALSEHSLGTLSRIPSHLLLSEVLPRAAENSGYLTQFSRASFGAARLSLQVALGTVTEASNTGLNARYGLQAPLSRTELMGAHDALAFLHRQLPEFPLAAAWVTHETSLGNLRAATAVQRIRLAYEQKATYLNLSSFGLTSLPDLLCDLPHLTHLELADNNLTELPPQTLGLRDNQLKTLPHGLENLAHLKFINLERNPIVCLPQWCVPPKIIRLGPETPFHFVFPAAAAPE
jgi:Leucine-rich repeat (LRR) protein